MPEGTPMMLQYHRIKEQHEDCILFFRLGDFYEEFFEIAMFAFNVAFVSFKPSGAGINKSAVVEFLEFFVSCGAFKLSPALVENRPIADAGMIFKLRDGLFHCVKKSFSCF